MAWNLSRIWSGALIGRRDNYIVLPIVYEWQTKYKRPQRSNVGGVVNRGRVLPYKRLMGMCRWMGSHFHDWINYNRITFSIEVLEWGRTLSDFSVYDSSPYLRLANVPECLYCRWKVKCSSFSPKNGSIHKNRKWLSGDRENYTFSQKWLRWGL